MSLESDPSIDDIQSPEDAMAVDNEEIKEETPSTEEGKITITSTNDE